MKHADYEDTIPAKTERFLNRVRQAEERWRAMGRQFVRVDEQSNAPANGTDEGGEAPQ